jgi:glycosyltransferase involved in cell wall biosynthesis
MSDRAKPNILVLEPYYGGSHRAFLDDLTRHLPFTFTLLTLPARKWKWRMRLAAPHFAEVLHHLHPAADLVLCSTFVDVATLRALAPPRVQRLPMLTYFHENQFAYPVQVDDERDFHFGLTNYTTALASDGLAFNSAYNLETFLAGVVGLVKKSGDMAVPGAEATIRRKAVILPPGLDFTDFPGPTVAGHGGAPVIVWNHRWEHDKNPERFFQTLYRLDREGVDFQLVVLGQAFERQPAVFEEARRLLAHRLLHFGYVTSRADYIHWLHQGDLVVSTADHEFFGMAVLEAVRAGCRPLLPNRLSYPELFPPEFLYHDQELYGAMLAALGKGRLMPQQALQLTEPFSWLHLDTTYGAWLSSLLV